jgi:uncharacterized protein YqeY
MRAMMSTQERILNDLKEAMKSSQRQRREVLRMLRAKIQEQEVALRAKKGRDYKLSEQETLAALSSYAKQRRQSIESYREGGRSDLVEKETSELKIVEEYLPKQLSESEIEQIVDQAIQESGAQSVQDLGKVMRLVMPRFQGAADGKVVNRIVREKLT